MEGDFKDDVDEDVFKKHVNDIRWMMDLFDEYGAKLTIESEKSFARANTIWDLNILEEIVDRGHGVGTHADFGAGIREHFTTQQYIQKFMENKKLVDDLVGAENNRGVSGGTGPGDWVQAAASAGFDFLDGVVGFAYLSMDLSERPEGWTDEAIRSSYFHDSVPLDFEQRLYPVLLKDAEDFTADEDGVLLVMLGDMGEIGSLEEGRKNCAPNCVLDTDDVEQYGRYLEEALAVRDPNKAARINIHIQAKYFTQEYEDEFRALLSLIQDYVDRGEVQWATQLESYEGYAAELGSAY